MNSKKIIKGISMSEFNFGRINRIILISLFSLFLISCKKEKQLDHPLVITGEIMNVTSKGAEFHGRITGNTDGIIDHGFVWDMYDEPLIDKGYQRSLGTYADEYFSIETEAAFKERVIYYVRAYARSSHSTVYGRTVEFKSLGGIAPQLVDFYPKEGTWSDTITIKGKNFSRLNDQNLIKIGINTATTIASSDTLLKALVPGSLINIRSKVSVTVFGNTSASTDEFALLPPEILRINPSEGPPHKTIILTGKNFNPEAKVYFDDKQAQIKSTTLNQIVVIVPAFFEERNVKITVDILGQINQDVHYFKVLYPVITGFSAHTGTWDDQLVIYGRNLPVYSNIRVLFSDSYAEISHKSEDSITVKVPRFLSGYSHFIKIKGNNQAGGLVYYQECTSKIKFELIKPTITGFIPEQAGFGDVVEISGTHFHPDEHENVVRFGEIKAEIISHTASLLKVKVPIEMQKPSEKISLQIYNYKISTAETFKLFPLEITSLDPLWFSRLHRFKIYGSGFNPDSRFMNVFWGNEQLYVRQQGPGFILVEKGFNINNYQHMETRTVRVEVAGQSVQFDDPVTYYEPWSYNAISDYRLESTKQVGFSIDGRHFISEFNYKLYEYLPGSNTLVARADLPANTSGTNDYSDNSTFSGASNAYFLHRDGFFRYDPNSDNWAEMNKFPGIVLQGTRAFKAGDTGYMIGAPNVFNENGTTLEGREVWRYNETDDSWTQVASFPSAVDIQLGVSFSLHGKGYVGLGQGPFATKLWEYDPQEDKWHQKIDLSNILGASVYASSSVFVIDNYAYIVGGQGSHSLYGEVYRYDPIKNTFTLIVGLPRTTSGAFGFTHQGKGYVLGGYAGGWISAVQIFDPSKLPPALLPD
jgi:hypothetical protein